MKIVCALLLILIGNEAAFTQTVSNYANLVNTRIGSKGKGHDINEGYLEAGYTFPGAMYPMGMVQFTPTFFAPNKGFVVNQLSGAGCDHMANFPVMPLAGALKISPNDMKDFKPEYKIKKAVAGFFEVNLAKEEINVALTVTPHTGMATFNFKDGEEKGTVVIGSGINGTKVNEAYAKITSENTIEGYADGGSFCGSATPYKIYFAAKFDQSPVQSGTWKDKVIAPDSKEVAGENSGVYLTFDLSKGKTIKYKFAVSYVSLANAKENLAKENTGWDFNSIKNSAQKAWNTYLSKIKVSGGSADEITQFYTNLYHAFGHPNISNDVNGQYMGADHKVHTVAADKNNYTSFSNWDTYRTQVQLISILAPKETSDIIQSTVDFAVQSGGSLPRWVMANTETGIMQGDPTSIVIANAFAFGAKNFDLTTALKVMRKGAEVPGAKSQTIETRPYLAQYLNKGYVNDASMTLEYTSADFAIGQFALQAFKNKAVYSTYLKRSTWWKNQFDPKTKWIRSKDSDGTWRGQNDGMREANYKSYYWMVPYNIKGLADIIGGNKMAEARLDDFFRKLNANYSNDWFAAGNEPDFQVPWAYNWVGVPYKTQALVKKIIKEQYSNKDNGLPGNDDLGAMGAFYVFANIGLFPVIPGVGGLSINSPSFSKISISLPSGKILSINGGSNQLDYIKQLKINGKIVNKTWLNWKDLAQGAKLQYVLSAKPNKTWGTVNTPPSYP
ncbi:MAG: glycoside hydrolase family 92 protein [Pedobacter sp.]|nr:glycoside hydrolase family 92 protein [Pedobacter sp.]